MRGGSADETENVQKGEISVNQNRLNYKAKKTRQQYNDTTT